MLRSIHEFGIDPASLIHALQNHDELTLELVHFWTLHANDIYTLGGQTWQGRTLRTHLRDTMYERLSGTRAPYNLKFVTNGVACTTASIITAALGITDLDVITDDQKTLIQKVHLLLVMYNAFQPGVFALSGWDLVGALPLPAEMVQHLMADGDTRWIQRGAYDLMNVAPDAKHSSEGMRKCRSLYGSLPEQLADPNSFASQLKHLLAVRKDHGIAASHQRPIPDVSNPGLLVMVHDLPDGRGVQITALNFGGSAIDETVLIPDLPVGSVVDMLHETVMEDVTVEGELNLNLEPYEGQSLRVVPSRH